MFILSEPRETTRMIDHANVSSMTITNHYRVDLAISFSNRLYPSCSFKKSAHVTSPPHCDDLDRHIFCVAGDFRGWNELLGLVVGT